MHLIDPPESQVASPHHGLAPKPLEDMLRFTMGLVCHAPKPVQSP